MRRGPCSFLRSISWVTAFWMAAMPATTGATKRPELRARHDRVQGTLILLYEEEFTSGSARLVHVVEEAPTGRRYRVRWAAGSPEPRS